MTDNEFVFEHCCDSDELLLTKDCIDSDVIFEYVIEAES